MPSPKSIIVLLSFLAFSCGEGNDAQLEALETNLENSRASDEFVNTIATRITDLGGGADLLTDYAEYEQLKRASEDQFFEKQLQRIIEFSPNAELRDEEKKSSLSEFESSSVTLCRRSLANGYLGSEGEEESFGFCNGNEFTPMSSEDFVRFLSYTLKAEKATDPIRQITSVRLNKKIRLIFEEGIPVYHVILSERQSGVFKLGTFELGKNGLEGGLDQISRSTEVNLAVASDSVSDEVRPVESSNEDQANEAAKQPESPTVSEAELMPNLDNLVTSYLDLQEGSNIESIMRLYDEQVRYNDKGVVSKSRIRQDKMAYFQRWPSRNHQRISSVTVKKGSSPDTHTARFNYSYDLRDSKNNNASGKVWMELTVKESNGTYIITRERGGSL